MSDNFENFLKKRWKHFDDKCFFEKKLKDLYIVMDLEVKKDFGAKWFVFGVEDKLPCGYVKYWVVGPKLSTLECFGTTLKRSEVTDQWVANHFETKISAKRFFRSMLDGVCSHRLISVEELFVEVESKKSDYCDDEDGSEVVSFDSTGKKRQSDDLEKEEKAKKPRIGSHSVLHDFYDVVTSSSQHIQQAEFGFAEYGDGPIHSAKFHLGQNMLFDGI